MGWGMVASGLAAVYAENNSRESLFDAMARKEVYATTGTRMMVRFFGGWDYTDADIASRNPAFAGYQKGVPMGGDIHAQVLVADRRRSWCMHSGIPSVAISIVSRS